MATTILGCPYPIYPNPRGYLFSQKNIEVLKADMLQLLLTNHGERIMMPDYGTDLRRLFFEPLDDRLQKQAKDLIAASITKWEPRIAVDAIKVTRDEEQHILKINIQFRDPENIVVVESLSLDLPL